MKLELIIFLAIFIVEGNLRFCLSLGKCCLFLPLSANVMSFQHIALMMTTIMATTATTTTNVLLIHAKMEAHAPRFHMAINVLALLDTLEQTAKLVRLLFICKMNSVNTNY